MKTKKTENNINQKTAVTNSNENKRQNDSPINLNHVFLIIKKLLIWGGFFGILYLLRDLFGLVFFTFILSFIVYRVNEFIATRIKVSRKLMLVLIYLILILIVGGIGYYLGPKFFEEAKQFGKNIPELENKIKMHINKIKLDYPSVNQALKAFSTREQVDAYIYQLSEKALSSFPVMLYGVLKIATGILLAIIFSFLILIDLAEVVYELKRFESTKIRNLYNELARPIVRFGHIVGLAFEAQTIIAIINTILTCAGMLILGIQEVAFLSIIVFMCSFIPVLGVFISSIPLMLISFNTGGLPLAFSAFIMVIVVHAVEAYILNPHIYAAHMKINPVFVLIVLFIGHHAFGLWGMLMAVPVTFYFMRYIAGLKSKFAAAKEQGSDKDIETDADNDSELDSAD